MKGVDAVVLVQAGSGALPRTIKTIMIDLDVLHKHIESWLKKQELNAL